MSEPSANPEAPQQAPETEVAEAVSSEVMLRAFPQEGEEIKYVEEEENKDPEYLAAIEREQANIRSAVISGAVLGGAASELASRSSEEKKEELFEDLSVAQFEHLQEIESLCMRCHEQGVTRLLLTRIPYFRDVIVYAFECPHCNHRANDIQSAREISEFGRRLELQVDNKIHLNRQVIKEFSASIIIPDIEFEIPPRQTRGAEINTVEGFITNAADNLSLDQPARFEVAPEIAQKIQVVIDQLREFAEAKTPFTFVLDDPSGNSFIQNPFAPAKDPFLRQNTYPRTREQDTMLGLAEDNTETPAEGEAESSDSPAEAEAPAQEQATSGSMAVPRRREGVSIARELERKIMETYFDVNRKSATIPGVCHSCHQMAETRMCITEIPLFKEIVLMVTDCEHCGFRDTEIKPGGAVSPMARKCTLRVTSPSDMARDLLKPDTSGVSIPEIDLELTPGTLGGKYTTVEGLLRNIKEKLLESNAFALGDSSTPEEKERFAEFVNKLDSIVEGRIEFTLIIDDPLGNAFIQNPFYPEADPNLVNEEYERTFEQNEELGLNDINVDNYYQNETENESKSEL
eukprot:TRINITY_DN1808_c0_g5_i1.p1 TRINITY_DN1808_c0_g5~~TRINITY_DN1808_c0_g5_i1.p1  ORF type:complete len:574 (-),score=198.33 TRINITY_DN1808_c0_g5_i1:61-1782(-)